MLIAPRNLFEEFTIETEITPDLGFEPENVQTTKRGKYWRSPDQTDQWIGGTRATSVTINGVMLSRHLCQGGSIRFVGYSGAGYTGSTVRDTTVQPVFAPITTGYDWGISNFSGLDTHDPFGLEAPWWAFFDASTIRSFKFFLSSKSTTYGFPYWKITTLFGGSFYDQSIPVEGMSYDFGDLTENLRSRGGSKVSNLGARFEKLNMSFNKLTQAQRDAWVDFFRYAQTGRAMGVSVFPGEGGRTERDHTGLFFLVTTDALGYEVNSRYTRNLQLEAA